MQNRGATCELLPPTCSRRSVARSPAPLRRMSLGRWENTQTCRARAPCRAGFEWPKRYERALYRREASILRRKTVVRRASCDLQRTAGVSRDRHASATELSVSREVAKHASLPRARYAALAVISFCAKKGHCTGGRLLSFGARPGCDVRAVTSNMQQPPFAWNARQHHCACCLSGD